MALSGSITNSICSGHYGIKIDWTATQNIANNTSTITAKMYLVGDWELSISARTHTLTIDGTETSISSAAISKGKGSWSVLLGTATKTVTHNADGTKSVNIAGLISFKATIQGTYYANIEASSTVTLNTIARASQPTLTASTAEMGTVLGIYTNRASSSFTHAITYTFGSATGTISSNATTAASWTVPLTLANQIPNATSGTGTITCKTYNGSTLIGTKTVTFTATVPSTVVPSISAITCTDPKGYLSTYGGYVQNKSTLKVTATAAGAYSSTIKSYKIVANGVTYTSNGCTTGVLKTSGTNTITVTVTDSRGRTATKTTTISVLAYTAPTITTLSAYRCLSDGTADEEGAYMKVTVAASITSLNSKNTKSFVLKYKIQTATSYTTYTTVTNAYSLATSYIIAAGVDNSYDIQLVATDAFEPITANTVIGTSYTLMDFRNTGKGIAFGKASEKDAFECNMDAEFSGVVDVAGALVGGTVKTSAGADLDTAFDNSIWRSCTVAPSTTYGTFSGSYRAKYRYTKDVLEICVRGTWYAAYAAVAEGQPLMRVTGLDVSIPSAMTAPIWDDTAQIWRVAKLETDGYIKLGSNTNIPKNYWLSCNTLNFKIFRT